MRQSLRIRHQREKISRRNEPVPRSADATSLRPRSKSQRCFQLFPSLSRGCGPPTRASFSIPVSWDWNLYSLPGARGRGDNAGKRGGLRLGREKPGFYLPRNLWDSSITQPWDQVQTAERLSARRRALGQGLIWGGGRGEEDGSPPAVPYPGDDTCRAFTSQGGASAASREVPSGKWEGQRLESACWEGGSKAGESLGFPEVSGGGSEPG